MILTECPSCYEELSVEEIPVRQFATCDNCAAAVPLPARTELGLTETWNDVETFSDCPMCGSENSDARTECEYCGESLAHHSLHTPLYGLVTAYHVKRYQRAVRLFSRFWLGLGIIPIYFFFFLWAANPFYYSWEWLSGTAFCWCCAVMIARKSRAFTTVGLAFSYLITLSIMLGFCWMLLMGIPFITLIFPALVLWLCGSMIVQGHRILNLSRLILLSGIPLSVQPDQLS